MAGFFGKIWLDGIFAGSQKFGQNQTVVHLYLTYQRLFLGINHCRYISIAEHLIVITQNAEEIRMYIVHCTQLCKGPLP